VLISGHRSTNNLAIIRPVHLQHSSKQVNIRGGNT